MNYAAQIGITYLAVVCVLLSFSLISGTGAWRHAHWTGKAALLLLAWMTFPHRHTEPQVALPANQRNPRLTEKESAAFAAVETELLRMRSLDND